MLSNVRRRHCIRRQETKIRDDAEHSPAAEIKQRKITRRKIGFTALATAIVLGCGSGSYFARDVVQDERHDPTPREQAIEQFLEHAYDMDIRKVRCLSAGQMAAQDNPIGPWEGESNDGAVPYAPVLSGGFRKLFLPYIRLKASVCEGIIAFAENPPQTRKEVDDEQADPLHTAVHEAWSHIKRQIADERRADCEAAQVIENFALALGASAEAADSVQIRNARLVKTREKEDLRLCYEGGPWDLRYEDIRFPYDSPPQTS